MSKSKKKYFGEKPLEGPVPFGDLYKQRNSKQREDVSSGNRYYPSPAELREYDRISEGSSSHIIAMLDKEQINRYKLSEKAMISKVVSRRLGMLFCFLAVIAAVSASIFLAMEGHNTQSIFMSVSCAIISILVFKLNKTDEPRSKIRNKRHFRHNRSRS